MKVFIMRGVSGSGKSTVAYHIRARHPRPLNVAVVSADDFFQTGPRGEYRFDPDRIGEAHAQCLRRFMSALESRRYEAVIVDNTNMRLWECAPYVAIAQSQGADVELIHVTCDPKVAAERNTHGVPLDVVLAQYASYERALPWWDERVV